jgi:hypothetical protein
VLSREAHKLRLGNHVVQAADRLRPAKHLQVDTCYHPRPAGVPRWCPHQGHTRRRSAVAWNLQADRACDEVGSPTSVRDPAAHTKESAGERSTTALAPPRPPAPSPARPRSEPLRRRKFVRCRAVLPARSVLCCWGLGLPVEGTLTSTLVPAPGRSSACRVTASSGLP